jgi:hypothetical protein
MVAQACQLIILSQKVVHGVHACSRFAVREHEQQGIS